MIHNVNKKRTRMVRILMFPTPNDEWGYYCDWYESSVDTVFKGFDANEALIEMKKGNCTDSFVEAYKQTDIGMVLKRMTNLNNVIIKQGYFPESLKGLEEDFAFVSIDVDFEESIYECLKYFYPRLSKGGYIFVHDYNSSLLGVEKAVDRYENDINQTLCKMPLCDANGTLVIMKG